MKFGKLILLVFGWLALTTFITASKAQPAEKTAVQKENRGAKRFYVEFRVATIGAYGHSYVAYGTLNSRGEPAQTHYADLHPTGNYALMALGHVLPVPANTEWNPEVLALPVASSYRKNLSAAEYQKLIAAVSRAKANKQPVWHAIANNCNHFVAELARAIGLRAPSDLHLSYSFVPALRALNE
jgi:hypothetical protein